AREDRPLTMLRFDSETGVPQYDRVARKVYVNLQDKNVLAVVDPATDTIVGRYPVAGCKGNHGMAIDPERRRAFLSCEGNDVLAVFNLDTKKVIATLPMAKGADVVQFDPGLGRIYVACGSGAISVFQMDDPDRFRKVEDVRVPRKVHSLVVDVKTHRVYAPAEEEDGRPVAKMLVFDAIPGASSRTTGKSDGAPPMLGLLKNDLILAVGTCVLAWSSSASAYRPFVSTDAAVADPKEIEIELGYFTLDRTRDENTFIIPRTVLNYGLFKNWEAVAEFAIQRAPDATLDVIDPALSLKVVLKEGVLQDKKGFAVAVEASALLPSTEKGQDRFGFVEKIIGGG